MKENVSGCFFLNTVYSLLLIDRMVSVMLQRSRWRHRLPPPPSSKWPWRLPMTSCDDAVDGGPCIHLNNRIHYKSSKATCDNDFGPHTDSIFRGSDLYVRATYTRVYTVYTAEKYV